MKKSIILVALVFTMLFATVGCSKNEDYAMEETQTQISTEYDRGDSADYNMAEPESPAQIESGESYSAGSEGSNANLSEKVIYYVDMSLVADDPGQVADEITAKVNSSGGYVSYKNSNSYDGSSSYVSMQVRVPSAGLEDLTDYVETIADVQNDNMYTENVTENYYDIVTRLEHEQLQAEQLEKLLTETTTIEEVLLVREELSQVQETIEVYEGRIKMWDSLVDYSTVSFYITETQTLDDTSDEPRLITFGETGRAIVRAFKNSAVYVANFFSWLLRVVSALLIPALIITPIVVIIVKLSKRKKNKSKDNKEQ